MNVICDHLHLRSPAPETAAQFYAEMFGATIRSRSHHADALRVVVDLGGLQLFIEQVPPQTLAPPAPPFLGIRAYWPKSSKSRCGGRGSTWQGRPLRKGTELTRAGRQGCLHRRSRPSANRTPGTVYPLGPTGRFGPTANDTLAREWMRSLHRMRKMPLHWQHERGKCQE